MKPKDGWQHKKLTDLAEYINGYAFKPVDWGKDGLPIIRIEQLRNPDSVTDYYLGRIPDKNIIDNGDLIFSWSASLILRIWHHGKAALNQHLFKVIEKPGVDRNLLRQFIDFHLPEITRGAHGSTMQHITRKELTRFGASFPTSKSEQAKIADVLSTVDRAIQQTEALIAKQQRIITGLMQDLLTRGIDEHGNLRSEQTHKFRNSRLGRIPVEWEVVELATVTEFVTSGSRGWAQYYSEEGAIFLRIGNLTRNHINLRLDDIVLVNPPKTSEGKRTSVSAGDLLISITADLGIISVIPDNFDEGYVNQHIALVRIIPANADARFVGWFLSGRGGQAQFEMLNESGAKAGLNLPTIRKLLVPVTTPTEQALIAEILDDNTSKVNHHYSRLGKLRSLKTALMHDLLTGRKRVTALLDDTEVAA